MQTIEAIFAEHQKMITDLQVCIPQLQQVTERVVKALKSGGKVLWMGNGGSAADAQHMAAELIGRFKQERRALPAIALTTDTSVLTCLSNDYAFSEIFARQLEALCQPQDVVMALSTSGNSENVLRGVAIARQRGAYVVGFTGHQGGKLKTLVDSCFIVPSNNTARIQEGHALLCHTLCEAVEEAFV